MTIRRVEIRPGVWVEDKRKPTEKDILIQQVLRELAKEDTK